jgi:maltooligosyltrehalose trehalohydrolase
MLQEFAPGLDAAEAKLPYLRDLGVNCIEVMPVANVERSVDWGFEPIGLFGVDERFGNRRTFQRFVESAHRHGIAVVLEMIYGHTGRHFAYEYVYANLRYEQNPFMGPFGDEDLFGASTHGKHASSAVKTEELHQVGKRPAGPLAFDFHRTFACISPEQGER